MMSGTMEMSGKKNIHPCMMMSGMVEMWEDQCCCSVVRWLPPAPHHAGSSPHPHLPGRPSSSSSVSSSNSGLGVKPFSCFWHFGLPASNQIQVQSRKSWSSNKESLVDNVNIWNIVSVILWRIFLSDIMRFLWASVVETFFISAKLNNNVNLAYADIKNIA